jgi:hypothetical protein
MRDAGWPVGRPCQLQRRVDVPRRYTNNFQSVEHHPVTGFSFPDYSARTITFVFVDRFFDILFRKSTRATTVTVQLPNQSPISLHSYISTTLTIAQHHEANIVLFHSLRDHRRYIIPHLRRGRIQRVHVSRKGRDAKTNIY